MSTTSQPTDYSDLYTDLLNRTRQDTGVTATADQARRYINIALHDMHIGYWETFPWAERQEVLRTQPQYTTGTVSINKGSTTLTGSSTKWTTNNSFGVANARSTGKIAIAGSQEVYRISSVDSDTQITLLDPFIDADVSGEGYTYFEDEYDLASDFLRPLDLQNFDTEGRVPLIGRNEFRRRYPRNNTTGKPKVATIVDAGFSGSTSPVRRVRFWQPPDQAYLIPYAYVTDLLAVDSSGNGQQNLSADADEPIVPLAYRHAIVFHALYHWYRDRKDDGRSQQAKAEYQQVMQRITADTEVGAKRPKLEPRLGPYRSAAKRPYRRGRAGRFVTGNAFDQFRE